MNTKLITFQIMTLKPYLIAKIEDGFRPHPKVAGAFKFKYKSYEVPSNFDLNNIAAIASMYFQGLSENTDGTIRKLSDKKFKKVL